MWTEFRRLACQVGHRYASFSDRRPHIAAALTAAGVLGTADVFSQHLTLHSHEPLDTQRTTALVIWGTYHYGFPQKWIYLVLDRLMWSNMNKMVFDVFVNGGFHVIPSFYICTGLLKGQSLERSVAQLRDEWFDAQFYSAAYWAPLMYANFVWVPQHSRILVVVIGSFIHKSCLSWFSNRRRVQDHRDAAAAAAAELATQEEAGRDSGAAKATLPGSGLAVSE